MPTLMQTLVLLKKNCFVETDLFLGESLYTMLLSVIKKLFCKVQIGRAHV